MSDKKCETCSDFRASGDRKGGYCDTPDGPKDEQKRGAYVPNDHTCNKHSTGFRCHVCEHCSDVGNIAYRLRHSLFSLMCNNINSPNYKDRVASNSECDYGESREQVVRYKKLVKANNKELDFNMQLRPLLDDAGFRKY